MNSELSITIEKKVFELILASPNVKIEKVDAEMDLEAIKMDSLETLSMAMDLEEEFDVQITDEEVGEFKKVNDVLEYMDAKLLCKQAESSQQETDAIAGEEGVETTNSVLATSKVAE